MPAGGGRTRSPTPGRKKPTTVTPEKGRKKGSDFEVGSVAGRWAVRGCFAVLFGVGMVLLALPKKKGEAAATPSPAATPPPAAVRAATPAAPEVMDLLASLGLVEYSTVFAQQGLDSLHRIAGQRPERGPSDVRLFHWRRIVKEARARRDQGKKKSAPAPPPSEAQEAKATGSAASLREATNNAREDGDAILQPKSRTLGKCHVTRRFLGSADANDAPPLFWSFPGSGNTWIRFLLEQATGIYTGSVYQDLDIIKLMPGELRCDKSVVAVKGHPNWTPFDLVDGAYKPGHRYWVNGTTGTVESGRMDLDQWNGIAGVPKHPIIKTFHNKCGSIKVERALVVIRHPYSSLWAEYQRMKSETVIDGIKRYGHVSMLLKKDFDPTDMRKHMISLMQDWFLQFEGYEGFIERNGCQSILFQPFEEIATKSKRDFVLQRVCSHLRKPMVTTPDCAFRLADHPGIRRAKTKNPDAMSMDEAFNHPEVGNLICDLWEIAGREMEVLGYKIPRMGPTHGICPAPRRLKPVISKHLLLTSGTLNCKTDRVPGQSGSDYFLQSDMYDNTTTQVKPAVPQYQDDQLKKDKESDEDPTTGSGERPRPYVSFVTTGRNDLHSGNALERLQFQLLNLALYSERYKFYVEVIIVEWNPDANRKNLGISLKLPAVVSGHYITIRIVSVPPRLHEVAVDQSIHLPVQQYVGKNVGMRRALGEWIIAWNGDMLLNGAFWDRLQKRNFQRQKYYRIDRLDIDKPLPAEFDVGNLEGERENAWLQLHTYQIRTAVGTRQLPTNAEKAHFWNDFLRGNDTTGKFAARCCASGCSLQFKSCRWQSWKGWEADRIRAEVPKLLAKGDMKAIEDILNIPQQFHANAPGDFLMLHRDDWLTIRGYPEAPYQDEMDKYPMPQAFAAGMEQEILGEGIASVHQYHPGSWGAKGAGSAGLTKDMRDRPSLGPRKYIEDGRDMLIRRKPATLWEDGAELACNNKQWGFGNIAMHEVVLVPLATNSTRTALRVVRQPHDQLEYAIPPGCGWKYSKGAVT